mgnify:FL=1
MLVAALEQSAFYSIPNTSRTMHMNENQLYHNKNKNPISEPPLLANAQPSQPLRAHHEIEQDVKGIEMRDGHRDTSRLPSFGNTGPFQECCPGSALSATVVISLDASGANHLFFFRNFSSSVYVCSSLRTTSVATERKDIKLSKKTSVAPIAFKFLTSSLLNLLKWCL